MVYRVTLCLIELLYCDVLSPSCLRGTLLEFIDVLANPSAKT